MTIAWVTVEMPLDFFTGLLFARAGGSTIEKEMPRPFSSKIKFCRKGFAQLEPVKVYNETATLILNEMVRLSDERHRLIHGLVDNFTPVMPGEIRINRIKHGPQSHSVETTRTSLIEIGDVTQEIVALGQGALLLVNELAKNFGIVEKKLG
jgi:hypothetical protein